MRYLRYLISDSTWKSFRFGQSISTETQRYFMQRGPFFNNLRTRFPFYISKFYPFPGLCSILPAHKLTIVLSFEIRGNAMNPVITINIDNAIVPPKHTTFSRLLFISLGNNRVATKAPKETNPIAIPNSVELKRSGIPPQFSDYL